jgi:GLPGLI family protein
MKNVHAIAAIGILHLLTAVPAQAQKKVSELTLVYDYSVVSGAEGAKKGEGTQSAIHTIYIKGSKSRSEMTDSLFSSVTLFDASTGSAVILKEVSGQKLLIRLNPQNWQERNSRYNGLVFTNTTETKVIAGYTCIKAIAKTRSGTTITVFYTKDIVPEYRDYEPQFKSLEGLPLEYELANGTIQIRYKVARINFNPVPVSKFDIPVTGYREMKYEESKNMNMGG